MSRLDVKAQKTLLKEAKMYLKDVEIVAKNNVDEAQDTIVLTQEHLYAWLEVFYDDRIRMDTCNQASVRM